MQHIAVGRMESMGAEGITEVAAARATGLVDAAQSRRIYLGIALVALAIAAATGVLLRFALLGQVFPWAANFGAMRHAHSHLMYFGWGTLGIMALLWAWLPVQTGRALPRGVGLQLGLTAVLSLLSFPAFWVNGYGTTHVLGRDLPLGSMAAAINGLPWFLFAWLYWRATRGLSGRTLAVQLWDWALVLLMLASAGAMGVGVLAALDVESHVLRDASLHLFLDIFAVGWFTLATLGLLWAWLGRAAAPQGWMPTQALGLCLGATFLLGMSPALVPPLSFWIAAVANLAAALLLARHLWALWQRRAALPGLAWFGLALLGVHVLMAFAVITPGVWRWSAGTQLRVYFLHNLLLGWMSSALLGLTLAALDRLPRRWLNALALVWVVGVGLMLLALLGLGMVGAVPLASPITWLRLAAWASFLPAAAALVAPVAALLPRRSAAPRRSQEQSRLPASVGD